MDNLSLPFSLTNLSRTKKIVIILTIVAILIGSGYFFLTQKRPSEYIKSSYVEGYRLVNEKISQSANIVIYLPEGVDKSIAQKNIKFYPEIKGKWLESNQEREIVFKPEKKLRLNRYYSVELSLPQDQGAVMKADFLAVDDPAVIAIFPKENSEAPEDSEITIVFNRPMVPLTTLGYLEANQKIPVEITPFTKGRFKWITVRNLQFIPDDRLKRSTRYRIKIKPGMVSMDGLEVEGRESSFITRRLRYTGDNANNNFAYNRPIKIYFNQPVDLERTRKEISLINNTTRKEIPFIAQYEGETTDGIGLEIPFSGGMVFGDIDLKSFSASLADTFLAGWNLLGKEEGKEGANKEINKSVIEIYNAQDKFFRKGLWDFRNRYTLRINKAYPLEGDVNVETSKVITFSISSVVRDITARSDKTSYTDLNFFDPQGELLVTFWEDIDLSKSIITGTKIKDIRYKEKCKEGSENDKECEKVPDKKSISITFRAENIGKSERLEVNFEKIVNVSGLEINKEPIKKYITTFPELKVLRVSPFDGQTSADLNKLVLCTNTPLLTPSEKDYQKYFSADRDYELEKWGSSWKIDYLYKGEVCRTGEFHTTIQYNLIPLTAYSVTLNLEDVFGQQLSYSLKFTTGPLPSESLLFYHLQKRYNVTSLQKTSLTFVAKNMTYVNMEICKIGPLQMLKYLKDPLSRFDPPKNVSCERVVYDKINLPDRYWTKNYFKVNIKDYFSDPLGHYILTFYHPNYLRKNWRSHTYEPIYERSYLTVTNLAAVEKRIDPGGYGYGSNVVLSDAELENLHNLYWVSYLDSLEPVSGAEIKLYETKNHKLNFVGSYTTNDQGIVSTQVIRNSGGVIITKGNDSTIIPSSYRSKLNYASNAYSAEKVYIYSDKLIYRPGQEVYIKGIYRIGYDGNYQIYSDKKISLEIYNSKGDRVLNKDLEINEFGTFNTKFVLDKEVPLGTYRVCVNEYRCSYFEVQEYVPAAFEVKVNSDKEEYISKDTINLEVVANYYFGVPLEKGEVSYTIASQNYYFDRYSDGYFNFGSGWYYRWYDWGDRQGYGDKFILRGETSLDENGKAKISEVLDLEKLFSDEEDKKSKIIIVDVTVQDSQGRSVSVQKSFILHKGEFYIGVKSEKSFLAKNETTDVNIKTVDTQGKELKVRGINLDLYKTEWIWNKRLSADGGYSYHWEKKKNLVRHYTFDTNRNGNYTQPIQLGEEGKYVIEVSAKDSKGNLVSSSYNLYVYGEKQASVAPTKDTKLEMSAEKRNLNVGDQASLIIESPYKEAKALIAIERGKIFDWEIVDIKGSFYNYKFKIKDEYIPNVYASVLLLSSESGVKFGKIEFKINTERKKINVAIKSNKTYYLPGEEVILNIKATDYMGRPVVSEFSVAVVDLSVLALKGNPKKNPLIFFYGGFPLTVSTASNIKNILPEVTVSTKGGGGMSETTEGLARKKRGEFRETAFWSAIVRTNSEGKAQVKFVLPDNLTTWQTEAVGVSKDTKLGVGYQEFLTKKELMVVPLNPRFVVPGDKFYLGAKIFNQSSEKQKLNITFTSLTLFLDNDQPLRSITLKPGETETVYFKVIASPKIKTGIHRFIISAQSDSLEDIVENTIAVTRNNTYETVAAANYTTDQVSKEYVFLPENIVKDRGELTIKSSATLAVFLSDALNYLIHYPYGCSEQIASKLNAIAVVKRGLNLPNISDKFHLKKVVYQGKEYSIDELVDIGLSKLYRNQNFDGGFSYWGTGESNFYLTLHVLNTLHNLSLAGYDIDSKKIERASQYLYHKFISSPYYSKNKDLAIKLAYVLFRIPEFSNNKALKEDIIQIANNDLFINDQIGNDSLAYLAVVLSQDGFDKGLRDKILSVLENRTDIDARGAFLDSSSDLDWEYWETPIKNTAIYLKALVAARGDNPIIDKTLRWLLNSRAKDGAWGSTNNTLSVIDAFVDFLEWKKETESNFDLSISVNDQTKKEIEFKKENILDQLKIEIPVLDLKINSINIVEFLKNNHNNLPNALYYDLALRYYLSADRIPPRDEGFSITRDFYRLDDKENKNPLHEARVGDILRGHIQITVPKTRNFVLVEDFIPAGMEIVNLDLATEQKSLRLQEKEIKGREFYPDFKELRDDRVVLFKEKVSPGVYEFEYFVRVLVPGKFTHLPAVVSEMYFPENFGRTDGRYFKIIK